MKKYIILILICCFLGKIEARNLMAYLTYSTFVSPTDGPYIETYLSIAGSSVHFIKKDNGKFQASVNISMIFHEGAAIRNFKKYELFSPEIDDTLKTNFNFLDQQRILLPDGKYDFEINIADKNSKEQPFTYTQPLEINFPADKVNVSGIELIYSYSKSAASSELTKSGFDLVPNIYNYYPEKVNHLIFYSEIYNTTKTFGPDGRFLLSYYIEVFENNSKLLDYAMNRKETAKPVNVVLGDFDISKLPSGNYNLVIEVRSPGNEVVASNRLFIQRNNPNVVMDLADIQNVPVKSTFVSSITNRDTLASFIDCLYPISTQVEKSFAQSNIKTADVELMQKFFYYFWQKRNNLNPEQAWLTYRKEVKKVNYNFKTAYGKGYQTDRGRIYLQYGPPNTRTQEYNEPNSYPYEIWQYYKLSNNQTNRKFVFYTRDLAANDFVLLHSDAMGETNNPRWMVELRSRTNAPGDLQQNSLNPSWGSRADDIFKLPN